MIAALDRLYTWVVSHRVLAGALLLLGVMTLWSVLTAPIMAAVSQSGAAEETVAIISWWWFYAREGLSLVTKASVWLICAAYLLSYPQAWRTLGGSDERVLFVLKRAAALLFLLYYSYALILLHQYTLLSEPVGKIAMHYLTVAGVLVAFLAAIALAAFVAQRAQERARSGEREGEIS